MLVKNPVSIKQRAFFDLRKPEDAFIHFHEKPFVLIGKGGKKKKKTHNSDEMPAVTMAIHNLSRVDIDVLIT